MPTHAPSRTDVPFWAHAAVSNCTAEISCLWSFGDGGSSTNALARHAYPTNGIYGWQLVASAAGISVTNSGTVAASDIQTDSDGDGIDDDWEWAQFQSLTVAGATTDFDSDGQPDRDEYLAGTLPKDAASKLAITGFDGTSVSWSSAPNRAYTIQPTTSLVSTSFAPLETGVRSSPPENEFTDLPADPQQFYRIDLE